jgi:hypothetical protein
MMEATTEINQCLREIVAIEAELLAGNPEVAGLLLALADWHAELRILQDEERRREGARRREGNGISGVQALTE